MDCIGYSTAHGAAKEFRERTCGDLTEVASSRHKREIMDHAYDVFYSVREGGGAVPRGFKWKSRLGNCG